jgi:FAD:protein FMN transferase
MGTMFRIVLYAANVEPAKTAFRAAFDEVRRLDEALSDYREDSELNRLCRSETGRPVALSPELFEALGLSEEISAKTDGAFDVTLGPLIRLWRAARKAKQLPSEPDREKALASCGWRKLRLDPDARTATLLAPSMQLDLGGVAKGLAADRALEVLKQHGVAAALVAAGGDVRAGDAPPGKSGWKIGAKGLGSPDAGFSRVVTLANRAVSTSGDAEQFVEIGGVRYSHIVDPRTGLGLSERLSATVIASFGARADALATAASVLGAERGLRLIDDDPDAEALVVRAGEAGYVEAVTKGFPGPE